MEATSKRNELVRILSEVYRACSVAELEPITYLIQGRLAPFFEPVEIGLGERLLMAAMSVAYSVPKEEVAWLTGTAQPRSSARAPYDPATATRERRPCRTGVC